MSRESDLLLQRMRRQRQVWVDLEPPSAGDDPAAPRKGLCLLRPRFEDLRLFQGQPSTIIASFTVDWRGVTEADLVASGGSDPVPFDREILTEWLADRPEFSAIAADWLLAAANERTRQRDADAKN